MIIKKSEKSLVEVFEEGDSILAVEGGVLCILSFSCNSFAILCKSNMERASLSIHAFHQSL